MNYANFYYSDALSKDPEGNLIQLCAKHAAEHRADVDGLAQSGDAETECELCDFV